MTQSHTYGSNEVRKDRILSLSDVYPLFNEVDTSVLGPSRTVRSRVRREIGRTVRRMSKWELMYGKKGRKRGYWKILDSNCLSRTTLV